MSTHPSHEISGTAFVVNYSRSRCLDISYDIYSNLWVTEDAIDLWNTFSKEVYPYDDLNISMRNRFYLNHLEMFSRQHPHGICLNLGAGFTNYPFLLETGLRFFEYDLPHVITYKKQAVERFISEGKLPNREVNYFAIDLNDSRELVKIKESLNYDGRGFPSIVILEGITYYLDISILNEIFAILHDIQEEGSIILFDYWKPETMEYQVMIRLKTFLDQHFGLKGQEYTLFDQTFIRNIQGYREIESISISELEKRYTSTHVFQIDEFKIPSFYTVMKRTGNQ